jgi:hypothetical protein
MTVTGAAAAVTAATAAAALRRHAWYRKGFCARVVGTYDARNAGDRCDIAEDGWQRHHITHLPVG